MHKLAIYPNILLKSSGRAWKVHHLDTKSLILIFKGLLLTNFRGRSGEGVGGGAQRARAPLVINDRGQSYLIKQPQCLLGSVVYL